MEEKLKSLGLYDFVRHVAVAHKRWCNFDSRHSFCYPLELLKDRKVYHYKHRENNPEIPAQPVVDVIFNMSPDDSDYSEYEFEVSRLLAFSKFVLKASGFHCRPISFEEDGKKVGFVLRVFADKDFPCTVHPEYISHTEGRSPCPMCKTELTFGEFHPLKIKPVNSRFEEIV